MDVRVRQLRSLLIFPALPPHLSLPKLSEEAFGVLAIDMALCFNESFLLSDRTPSEAHNRNASALSSCSSPLILATWTKIPTSSGIVQRPKLGHLNPVVEKTSFQSKSLHEHPGYPYHFLSPVSMFDCWLIEGVSRTGTTHPLFFISAPGGTGLRESAYSQLSLHHTGCLTTHWLERDKRCSDGKASCGITLQNLGTAGNQLPGRR